MLSKMKMVALTAITGLSLFQTGCNEGQIAASIILAPVIAAIAASSNQPAPRPRRPSYRSGQRLCRVHEETTPFRDEQGRLRYAYYQYDSCTGERYEVMSTAQKSYPLDVTGFASKYSLTQESAQKLFGALVDAQNATDIQGTRAALATIGINLPALAQMGADVKLTPEMVNDMAKSLDQDPKLTMMMLQDLFEQSRDQQAERNTEVFRST